jgi:hypothetical protein
MLNVPQIRGAWSDQIQSLDPEWGALLILVGLVYVFLGLRVYKVLVTLNCAAIGALLVGTLVTTFLKWPFFWALILAILGAVIFGYAAFLLARVAATLCAAIVGAVLGVVVAGLFTDDANIQATSGGLGLLVLGSLVFVAFEHILIAVFSFQGGVMVVQGALSAMTGQTGFLQTFRELARTTGWLVPFCVIALTVIGISVQIAGVRSASSGQSA